MTTVGTRAERFAPSPLAMDDRRREAVRRTDWRFLLPWREDAPYTHLALLGADGEVARLVLELGIAERVSTTVPSEPSVDAVVALAGSDAVGAAMCLKPGGVLYAEGERSGRIRRGTSPAELRRRLHTAGLETVATYWVRNTLRDRKAYLPVGSAGALSWYYTHLYAGRTARERFVGRTHRILARLGPSVVERVVRCYALVAMRPPVRHRAPSILGADGVHAVPAAPLTVPLVIATRLRRVVFVLFAPGTAEPSAILKVSRFPEGRSTANEQRVLTELAQAGGGTLDGRVPRPLGSWYSRGLLVGAETCIEGRPLARLLDETLPHERYAIPGEVAGWIAELHRQTSDRTTSWDQGCTALLRDRATAYERSFGMARGEERLFTRAHMAARALEGTSLPRVLAHGDFNPKNVLRTPRGIGAVDWEVGKRGLPLLDLLLFLEEWLHVADGARPSLATRLERFRRVFVAFDSADPATPVVKDAISTYMRVVGVSRVLAPVLQVLLWTDQAASRAERAGEATEDAIARAMRDRYVGCVRMLARHVDLLFE